MMPTSRDKSVRAQNTKGHRHKILENVRDPQPTWKYWKRDEVNLGYLLLQPHHLAPCETYNGLPRCLSGKESACQCRRCRKCELDPWSGRLAGEENGNPLKYSCLENPMDRGAWWTTDHSVAKIRTRLGRMTVRHKTGFQSMLGE